MRDLKRINGHLASVAYLALLFGAMAIDRLV